LPAHQTLGYAAAMPRAPSTAKPREASSFVRLSPAELQRYAPKHKIRFVTATALFDGHDASINIMRRLLQARGAEVIHLGHNRSAHEVVQAALQEDVQGVALSSYQGGHMEFFRYVRDLLDERGAGDVRLFGGGGGVIVPKEIAALEAHGITKIYSPEDGQRVGLDGIIGHMLMEADFAFAGWDERSTDPTTRLARALTLLENGVEGAEALAKAVRQERRYEKIPVLGITGTGGAGKSSLTDELIMRFLWDFPEVKIGMLCIDPSKKKTGGALLGDRIRINSAADPRVFIRSFATRGSGREIAKGTAEAIKVLRSQDFDFLIVETSGIGQGDTGIVDVADVSLYVMTSEYGAQSQLEKIDMLDFADLIAVNKYERQQAPDALRDVRTQLRRSRFKGQRVADDQYPVFGTIASRFSDDGVNGLYRALAARLSEKAGDRRYEAKPVRKYAVESSNREALIPATRINYLAEIARSVRDYHERAAAAVEAVRTAEALDVAARRLGAIGKSAAATALAADAAAEWEKVEPQLREKLDRWAEIRGGYLADEFVYKVRDKDVRVQALFESLSHQKLPKIAVPEAGSKAEVLRYLLRENVPGEFPYTAGVFPFRREGEDPKRQFAGEGGPGRTNKRFHYLSKGDPAKRLSTAFDSVTLYGAEPDKRPDIYGKVGESGVSIATLDDMKLLYSGFDLCSPATSVSMTINGPAPIILAMFLNTAVDQQLDRFVAEHKRPPTPDEHQRLYDQTLQVVRGTVQADILKEDQAQNTCIFSTECALKMMGDIQEYFIEKKVRNYYSVSISGYHIAEAGANPISQLAFTLANGFTYVEYYLGRGMKVDDFAPNLSFFFSNGLDPEYAVMGRVARRIWAIAMRDLYGADERSQKLKYHIQTSGRSLHAQEMDFNDIRTTLQALLALYDNCNSLHTNAFDEAITTPTEDSVRRAMAIQMIINREFGPNFCQNVNQGSYFLEYLTDVVEEAVLREFESLARRGGVLGAMETQYQRSKIQEESLHYEHLKHTGELPIIGVNTYLNPKVSSGDYVRPEIELIRASYEEKDDQLARLAAFKAEHRSAREAALKALAQAVMDGKNIFAELLHTVRHASLGEISETLYRVGGRYRRSM
jgi:methylmalonyl-CoA mutase